MLECHLHRLESNFSITAYFTFLKRKVHFKCVLLPRTRLCYFVFQFPVSPLQMNFRGARTAETDLHVNCHQKETVAVIESWNAQVSSNYDISCTKNTTVVVTLGKLKGKDFFFFWRHVHCDCPPFAGKHKRLSVHISGLYWQGNSLLSLCFICDSDAVTAGKRVS